MKETTVAIVVLNWNCADDSLRCVESLLSQRLINPSIILVDNDSHDDSVVKFEKYITTHPKVDIRLIKNSTNSGYAGGTNVGLWHALEDDYEYIGTLNPDAVADKDWLQHLVNELEAQKDTGIATGILARSDKKTIDSTGDRYTTWGIPSPRGRDTLLVDAPNSPEYIFGSTGGAFVAKASMFRDIGLFDEKFFMYFEDVDLSFRAQLAGYKVRYVPKAIAYHKLSVSANKVPGLAIYSTFKNLPMLFLKNVPFRLWITILPRFTLAYALILGNAIKNGRGLPALKGYLMSFVNLPHAIIERWKIKSQRRVSVSYIDGIILHDIPEEQTGLRKFRSFFIRKQA